MEYRSSESTDGRYVLRACFGGINEAFLACGSEVGQFSNITPSFLFPHYTFSRRLFVGMTLEIVILRLSLQTSLIDENFPIMMQDHAKLKSTLVTFNFTNFYLQKYI